MRMTINHGIGAALSMLLAVEGATVVVKQDDAHEGDAEHVEGEAGGLHGAAHDRPGSPATEAYRAANLAMHEAMDIEFGDDPTLTSRGG